MAIRNTITGAANCGTTACVNRPTPSGLTNPVTKVGVGAKIDIHRPRAHTGDSSCPIDPFPEAGPSTENRESIMPGLHLMASAAILLLAIFSPFAAAASPSMRVTTFRADITPDLGEPMFSCDPLRTVEQPLLAKGIVLESAGQRYVLCALDWCLLSNSSYDAMRGTIAAAAGTAAGRVAVQTVHQHTAPMIDMDAQKLLAEQHAPHLLVDPKCFDAIHQRIVSAIEQSLNDFKSVDRIGIGQAKVERVAATRRPVDASGKIVPLSKCEDPAILALPEGDIDPYLKTITLSHGKTPLVRLHYYATHPQTRYGDGRALSDMVGDAREALERNENVPQIYFTGCGGDVTVGKYNDGAPEDRIACQSGFWPVWKHPLRQPG